VALSPFQPCINEFLPASTRWPSASSFFSFAVGHSARAQSHLKKTPCMDVLHLFTAPDVPKLGPAEVEVATPRWLTNITEPPANLPGKGLAQHSMLYIGEGYNKMFLINEGKVIWTYSTGRGNEYDDVWMLSNGNILFTRMQYVAVITPKKGSRLALRRADEHRNPRVPAHRPRQSPLHPKRAAAQTHGREHQDQSRRTPARPSRQKSYRPKGPFTRNSAACATPRRALTSSRFFR
jgi:hypothetical protein